MIKYIPVFLSCALLISSASAQTSNPAMPGSKLDLSRVSLQANIIVVAKLITLGVTLPDALGQESYDSAQIHITNILKGNPSQNLVVSINVRYEKGTIEEVPPEKGSNLLYFVHTDQAQRQIVLKILPATDNNVAKVKALIAAGPAGK